jgi:transposase
VKSKREFTLNFKKQVATELIRHLSSPAQICRKYNICPSVLYRWKKQYEDGQLDATPNREAALQKRVDALERLAGSLSLENDFLKKALEYNVDQSERREELLRNAAGEFPSKKDVK